MEFKQTAKFARNFKKLMKKYKTLAQDLARWQNLISKQIGFITTNPTTHHSLLRSSHNRQVFVFKSRFHCRYLRGSSLRIIYFYFASKQEFLLVEIFFKGEKENEDRQEWERVWEEVTARNIV